MRASFLASSVLAVLAPTLAIADSLHVYPRSLANEHPGQLSKVITSNSLCSNGVITDANSTGKFEIVNGIRTYIAYPRGKKSKNAILYLSDIFGVDLINNQLLADSLARAGYLVAVPDLFDGDAVPTNFMGDPTFNLTEWRIRHPPAAIDAIVTSSISALRSEQFGVEKLGATGYCFGGKYVTRFLAPGKGLDAGFTAHPSQVVAEEYQAVTKPLSIAFGALDSITPAQRIATEAIFQTNNLTYQTALYAGAEHGFAVRTDLSIPQKKFAQESAYFQAVRFFDAWVKV